MDERRSAILPRGLRAARGLLFIGLALMALSSCDNIRKDFFDYLDKDGLPDWASIYPGPEGGPYEQPILIDIQPELGYEGWDIYYSLLKDADQARAGDWKLYDPDRGIVLARSSTLSVFFHDMFSRVFRLDYRFAEGLERSVYASPLGPVDGDGRTPYTAYRSLQDAVDAALLILADGQGPVSVRAQAGTYAGSLVSYPGVRLIGSYHGDWSPPGEGEQPSSIIQGDANVLSLGLGAYDSVPAYALRIPQTVSTEEAFIQGFELRGPAGRDSSTGLLGQYGRIRIDNCLLYGNGAVWGSHFTAGAWFIGAGARIERSWIYGLDPVSTPTGTLSLSAGLISIDSDISLVDCYEVRSGGIRGLITEPSYSFGLVSYDTPGATSAPGNLIIDSCAFIYADTGTDVLEAAGVRLMGGQASVRNCPNIATGMAHGAGARSAGIMLSEAQAGQGAYALIERNGTISAGGAGEETPTNFSAGLMLGAGARALIRGNNLISGGWAPNSVGVYVAGGAGGLELRDNPDIRGGDGPAGGRSAGLGILIDQALDSPLMAGRNSFWGGSGQGFHAGVYIQLSGDPVQPIIIRNNLIHGGDGAGMSSGILIQHPDADPAIPPGQALFMNNTVFSGRGALGGAAAITAGRSRPVFINNILHTPSDVGGVHAGFIIRANRIDADAYLVNYLPLEFRNNTVSEESTDHFRFIIEDVYNDAATIAPTPIWDSLAQGPMNALDAGFDGNRFIDPSSPLVFNGAIPENADQLRNFHQTGGLRLLASADVFLRTGGLDLSAYFPGASLNHSRDFYNALRTGDGATGWSVGAAEYFGP
jgi:hypothetical protein